MLRIEIFFGSLSDVKLKGSTHVLLGEGRGKNLDMFLLTKSNFIMINEFRYGQTWKFSPSPLSLSLYSTFKGQNMSATALRWFPSDTVHIVFIHIPSMVKPVDIFMVRNRVSKSCLMAELCFHGFVRQIFSPYAERRKKSERYGYCIKRYQFSA